MEYISRFHYEIIKPVTLNLVNVELLETLFSSNSETTLREVGGFSDVKIKYFKETNILQAIILKSYEGDFYNDETFIKLFHDCIVSGKILIEFIENDCNKWGYFLTYDKIEKITYCRLIDDEYMIIQNYRKNKFEV